MTSEQRHAARRKRREEKRRQKKAEFMLDYDDFDKVFTFDHLYKSYEKCRRSVSWKSSVQNYIAQAPLKVNSTLKELREGKFRTDGFYEFDIYERGKVRHIKSVTMRERVVQRCLCDYALTPVLSRTFIYDNGASLPDKGYHFSINRIQEHLRECGRDGYILLFDFSQFFDSIPHDLVKGIIRNEFTDERIIELCDHFVDVFGDVGLGLGSQISQILALAAVNRLDHFVKEHLRIRGYGRYMDDGYLIHKDKEYLKYCLKEIKALCSELGIVLNPKKTQIVKISHGFTWLKCRFIVTDSCKVIKKICKNSVTRERRKIKKLSAMQQKGIVSIEDVTASYQSWRGYASHFDAYRTIQNMDKLFKEEFL